MNSPDRTAESSIVTELERLLGRDAVVRAPELRARARNFWDPAPLEALALVRPRTTDELSAVLKLCHARGQGVVTHGGRTGVCDGDRATAGEVIVSLERMTAIEEIDPVGRTATVQAGCVLQTLQEAVERQGLLFPLDLGARGSCTIGGNVATNAGGMNVLRYGMMRALVLGLEAVLADGTVVSSLNRMLKNNSGYDLKQLFIGTEGTLGIVTRVVVALRELPRGAATALVAMERIEQVVDLLKHVDRSLGGTLSSYEVMWGNYYRKVTEPGGHVAPLGRDHEFYVIMEAQGSDAVADAERLASTLEEAAEAGLLSDAVLPKSQGERDRCWAIRENFEAVLQLEPLFLYDVSLPIRHMADYIERVGQRLREQWPRAELIALGHIADGNLHFFAWIPGAPDVQHEQVDRCVYEPLEKIGGAVSAEHGIGLEKKRWLSLSRSPNEIELMRLLKRSLDPKGILNRGKVVDA
jgi:FAD/FMN-containing dehydrogenase